MKVNENTKPSVAHSYSCYTHYFSVDGMSAGIVEMLLADLQASHYNGHWDSFVLWGKVSVIFYETTDQWEAREEFANELANDISDLLK